MPVIYDDIVTPEPIDTQPEDLWRLRPLDSHENMWDAELDDTPATPDERSYFEQKNRLEDQALFDTIGAQLRTLDYCDGMY